MTQESLHYFITACYFGTKIIGTASGQRQRSEQKNKPVLILNSLYLYQEKAASFTQRCNIFSNGKTW